MKVYLAGPMRGRPYFNAPAFHAAAAKLRGEGHEVFNPAEQDEDTYGPHVTWGNPLGDVQLAAERDDFCLRSVLATDLEYICNEADMIALLPGWRESAGARVEHQLACLLGLDVVML